MCSICPSMQLPALCSPQTATYRALLIAASTNRVIQAREFNSSGAEDVEWIITTGLREWQTYVVSITMETITGSNTSNFSFSKTCLL